tara:strand:+ start:232 stop:462 length:231 start_codon:yes stop_codon:yes gene_type:complete
MNDHQDSEHFTYERTWVEIHEMLDKAERLQNKHHISMQTCPKSKRVYHMRNYKALEGVIKALRWTLGDMKIEHPLE